LDRRRSAACELGTKLAFAIARGGELGPELLNLGGDVARFPGILCESKQASVLGLELGYATGHSSAF
jgi:hypothetical protein